MRSAKYLLPFGFAALVACDSGFSIYTSLTSFRVQTNLLIRSDSGNNYTLGEASSGPTRPTNPTNPTNPSSPTADLGSRLGMKGDQSLCAPASTLTSEQIAKIADLKRRLNNIIDRLQSAVVNDLYPGEKNTVRETPVCETFAAEISELYLALYPTSQPSNLVQERAVESASGVTVSDIDFRDEGHGWAVMQLNLSNGDKATFHTGVKTYQAESLFRSRSFSVPASITKQQTGLRFTLEDTKYDTLTRNYSESCNVTSRRTVCTRDPVTNQQVCKDETITTEGRRSVEQTKDITEYTYKIDFVSPDNSAVVATANAESTVDDVNYRYGECIANWNVPFPVPTPTNPGPFPFPL